MINIDKNSGSQNLNFEDSYDSYTAYRKADNSALSIGLFSEDLTRALQDTRTVSYNTYNTDGVPISSPILVPVDSLEWYNHAMLDKTYPGSRVMAYAHPYRTTPQDDEVIREKLNESLSQGLVIVTEKYSSDSDSPIARLIAELALDNSVSIDTFGTPELPAKVDFFVGKLSFPEAPHRARSVFDVYQQLVDQGQIHYQPDNGIQLAKVLSDEEAEKIWKIYKEPFDQLGANDPTSAGFTKEGLVEILQDESVVKVVNKVDGDITTLLIFIDDLSQAPWFNAAYYEKNYPEFYETGNIFMSPGVVSDESKRGNNYSVSMLEFLAPIFYARGSNLLLTFECTQISTTYIPKIVKYAIESSGICTVNGLEEPVGSIEYYGIKSQV